MHVDHHVIWIAIAEKDKSINNEACRRHGSWGVFDLKKKTPVRGRGRGAKKDKQLYSMPTEEYNMIGDIYEKLQIIHSMY